MLTEAMAPVLADIRRTGAPTPRLGEATVLAGGDEASMMLWSLDGTGSGVNAYAGHSPAERVARAAEMTQMWVIEDLWGGRNVAWPPCPRHPGSHPLWPSDTDGRASWVCPRDDAVVCAIGELVPTPGGAAR